MYEIHPYYPYISVEMEVVVTGGEETLLDWEQFNQEELGTLAFNISEATGEPDFYIYDASGDRMSARTGEYSYDYEEDFSASEQYWLMPGTYQKIEFQHPYLGVTAEGLHLDAGEEKVIDLEQIAGSLTLKLPEDATSLDFSVFKAADSETQLARVSDGQTGSRYWLAPGTYNIRFNNIYIRLITEVTIQAGQDTVLDLPELFAGDVTLLVLKPLKEGEELKYKIYLAEPSDQVTALQTLVDTKQYRVASGKYELQLASSCYYNVPRQEVDIQAQAITEVDFSSVVGWLSFSPPEGTTEQGYSLYTGAGDRLSDNGCTPTVGLGPGSYKIYPHYPYISVETEVAVTSGEETLLDWGQFNQGEVGTLAFNVSEATGEPDFCIYDASGSKMSARTGSYDWEKDFSASGQYWLMPGTYQKIEFQSPYLGVTVEDLHLNAREEKIIDLEQIAGSLTLKLPEDATSLDFSVFKAADNENELARVSDGQTGSHYWLAPGTYKIRLNNIYIGLWTEIITIQAGQDTSLDVQRAGE
jgi:hypothetical protein